MTRPFTVGSASALLQLANAASWSSATSPPRISAGRVVAAIARSISSTIGTLSQVWADVLPRPAATVEARIMASVGHRERPVAGPQRAARRVVGGDHHQLPVVTEERRGLVPAPCCLGHRLR